ncbi:DICT sensory domain-containing protein [Halobellus sp. H-GB7]|uniref:DICT sensory domain-containing protein n=1 Tax=Halobellus sp. H-GB7 TaxID=3069756 RepID=UPI0027ADC4FD|nr:DICT sensory domain-containing protein [Halobellus sp. H-GB7]MDQ2056074.1 DICT sensory domain-containing protein [Halobellus sp. H-GB7]
MLDAILEATAHPRKQFVVYRGADETDLESWFARHGVDVTHRVLPPGGPAPFLAIREDGKFTGVLPVESVEGLLEPPIARPGDRSDVSAGYRALFEVLDETTFATMERSELLAVSREIEDRALRVGRGTLRVSFQQLSAFEPQAAIYRYLARETALDIHVHGVEDWTPPAIDGVTYHGDDDSELDQYWTLAFDGGGDDTQACALLAREESDGYRGCWTNDPERVQEILSALRARGT